jgi:iron complex transport system ATP-binding protein
MISITNLSVARGKRIIVNNFSATIAPGSITAITGPNGCGKSTLAQAISGDLNYQSGEITIDGRELQTIRWKNRQISGQLLSRTEITGSHLQRAKSYRWGRAKQIWRALMVLCNGYKSLSMPINLSQLFRADRPNV